MAVWASLVWLWRRLSSGPEWSLDDLEPAIDPRRLLNPAYVKALEEQTAVIVGDPIERVRVLGPDKVAALAAAAAAQVAADAALRADREARLDAMRRRAEGHRYRLAKVRDFPGRKRA